MKWTILLTSLFLLACSSNRVQELIPPYQKERVCSDESLSYLAKKHSTQVARKQKYSDAEIHSRMLSLEPAIRSCYESEMSRTNKTHSLNLCFVIGYSPKGVQEFFEFSTKEITLSPNFIECLAALKVREELKGFKDLTVIQPYRLYPKQ